MESVVGKGSTFEVLLPLLPDKIARQREKVNDSLSERGSEHILWIDDELFLAELGKEFLQPYGYTVTSTTSSQDALDVFSAVPHSFDMIITDQTMPGMTGYPHHYLHRS